MSITAVIEYEYAGYEPAPECLAWDVKGEIVHTVGVIVNMARQYLAEIRTELEEAGLVRCGTAKARESYEIYGPKWREVWRSEYVVNHAELSPRAQKAQHEGAGRSRVYLRKANAKRARELKPYEVRIAGLAAAAEKKYPEMAGRAEKAAELVRRGHVAPQGGARFSVCSQRGEEIYLVHTERRTCTCYDFGSGKPPRINDAPMCKHRAAALMWLKIQPPDPAEIHRQEKQFRSALEAGII